MFALSTAWGARWTKDPAKLIEEARGLGFDCIEVHHSLSLLTVMGIIEAVQRGEIGVTSVHNFCPAMQWASGPDAYSPSSLDRRERAMAVKKTKETIEFAGRLGAKVVVMHLGRVAMKDMTTTLIEMYKAGERETPRFNKIKEKLLAKREKKRFRHLDALYQSLDDIVAYSEPKGIKIGIENRYCLEEIPFFDEIKLILDRFEGSNIHYWHDVGHAQCCEELDVIPHESFLRMFSDRMIGIHLHDVIGVSDHRVPSTGDFDFTRLKPYLRKETIKVVEAFVPPPEEEEVLRGMEYIRRCLSFEEEACQKGKTASEIP
jgi:sugar phosphate isomerase/epimerase